MLRIPQRPILTLGTVLISGLASMGGCKISVGGGGSHGNLNVGIPYYSQPGILLCAPTAVLMWRRYDGRSYVHPEDLRVSMGCGSNGCSVPQIRSGVNDFTDTHDAFIDDFGGEGDPDTLKAQFHSRQITSLASGTPVIATVSGELHVLVPNKGNYSTAPDGLKRWDYVYAHDPWEASGGPNDYYVAGNWMDIVVRQIISSDAIAGWQGDFEEHGNMHVRGGGGGDWPPADWPPEI